MTQVKLERPVTEFGPVVGGDALKGFPHPADYPAASAFLGGLEGLDPMLGATLYGEWYRAVTEGRREGNVEDLLAFARL